MLGEKVGSISGPTTMKALPAVNGSPSFETVAAGLSGTLAGTEVSSFATYDATMRADSELLVSDPQQLMAVSRLEASSTLKLLHPRLLP